MRKDEILQVKVVLGVTCNRENKFMTNDSGAAANVCGDDNGVANTER